MEISRLALPVAERTVINLTTDSTGTGKEYDIAYGVRSFKWLWRD